MFARFPFANGACQYALFHTVIGCDACHPSELLTKGCDPTFPPLQVERHNRPEIEDRSSKELLLPPVTISRSEREGVFIEPSINSTRISLRIKQSDDTERLLVHKFTAFLQQRAEAFVLLRRRPVPGYDLSFLITAAHLEAMDRERIVDFVVGFMEDIDKEVSAQKIAINARARLVAGSFLDALSKEVR